MAMSRVGLRTLELVFLRICELLFLNGDFQFFPSCLYSFFFFFRAFVGIKSHSLAPWCRQALLSLQGFRKAELLAAFHRFDVRREGA